MENDEKNKNVQMVIKHLKELHIEIIQKFQKGSYDIHNPCIARYLTDTDFVDWVFDNNAMLRNYTQDIYIDEN